MRLSEMLEHFFTLYGERNRYFMPNLGDRIDFLAVAIGDLQDAIRKDTRKEFVGMALSRIVSRIFCVAEYFNFYTIHTLDFVQSLSHKYPQVCAYCTCKPCTCSNGLRPECDLALKNNNQNLWELRDWCRHLDELYGFANKKKGVENILNRLSKEICELVILRFNMERRTITREEMLRETALELADAFAWTIAVTNFLEIDLEHYISIRYGTCCWRCKKKPCMCGDFVIHQIDWRQFK